ncbi:MAG TPA: hypothetical protein VFC21_03900, partial [Bryobacteraceae bacterium]|nr:hypothetical protein [Bryobacteraceae bacterium]
IFNGTGSFAQGLPEIYGIAINRLSPTPQPPDYNRAWRYTQSYFFAQDSFRVSPRFTLNFGIRYERFGAPINTGPVKDVLLKLGNGGDFNSRLAAANLVSPGSGNEQLYGADNGDWAPRFGFSWDVFGKSKTLLRGGFGIFYDRPFDNLWQTASQNNILVPFYSVSSVTNYLAPVASTLPLYANQAPANNFPGLTLLDPRLRNGYSQSSFIGVQQQVNDNLTVEVDGTSALGRRLITTDVVNRTYTIPTPQGAVRPNESLPDVSWRSSQGISDYYAFSTLVRYRLRNFLFQASYTLSHSIDNQSDPLLGDFINLNASAIAAGGQSGPISAFTQQYNSNADHANSQFDQRHNLFLLGIWRPQSRWRAARGWTVSWLTALRTGTPYTVFSVQPGIPQSGGTLLNQRADLINPGAAVYTNPLPAAGGVYLLNPAAFAIPSGTNLGTSGRNAFRGPGLYDLDTSLARSFAVPRLREGTIFTVRADFFNILNHANLGNPDSLLGDSGFGFSTYGRQGASSGFPAVNPLNETARQIQILLRLEF